MQMPAIGNHTREDFVDLVSESIICHRHDPMGLLRAPGADMPHMMGSTIPEDAGWGEGFLADHV